MEWTQDRIFQLIEDYRSAPILWDPRLPNYSNSILKGEAVKILAEKYSSDETAIKKKLKNLRSAFMREHHQIHSNLSAGSKRARWFAYEALYFLIDVITPKKRIPNNGENDGEGPYDDESQNSDSNLGDNPTYIKQEPDLDVPADATLDPLDPLEDRAEPEAKKARTSGEADVEKEILAMACRYLEKTTETLERLPTVVKLWGERLVSLDYQQRLFAEKAISDILFEASLGNLRKDSLKINDDP